MLANPGSQFMAALNTPLPPPSYGDQVSILSIDGGGIRGIIPATVLIHLDNVLKAKDPTTSLAHYFDVISGTSTGGLMALMLAAPNSSHSKHPLFTPSQVVQFYKTYGSEIFKPQRQFMAALNTPLPPPSYGDQVSILSIDGGGIRGIIPATVLIHLDNVLKAKDPTTSLAHYFDVISGTSTGGLMALMLAAPNSSHSKHPLFTPSQVVQFYKTYGSEIFKPQRPGNGPQFDGEFLHNITRQLLKDTRLSQTLTNVVIPAFDLKRQKPVIFSNYKLEDAPYLNALLSDICISTSAAPTQLPPHYFVNDGVEFNMVDGGVAAGNPTQATISEVLQHSEYPKILVLSLGTGTEKYVENPDFDARLAANWTILNWAFVANDMLGRASSAITEYYLASLFSGFQPPQSTYLRIDEHDLNHDFSNSVNVTKENLEGLEKTGQQLLQEKVVKMNLDTFNLEEFGETNAEALDR
ncbi:Acyl transferase/acyl hydrolase/lysophospholipase [Vigna unguiculata]|uniref:Patatin n=1 Tax=Vigna unguiculata TaxID=3917 RepID=A0A4D6MUQ3_VIGUN|nr:Acyl transferase/acyl hydrolase/lysophospholipase [Vigna unguiculata]